MSILWDTTLEFGVGYYTSRDGSSDFADYWGEVVDPDGNRRERVLEQSQYLDDVAEELEWLRSLEPGLVIDVGCGMGWMLAELPEWRKFGIEPCRKAAMECEQSGICIVSDLAQEAANQYDLVICHHVIEHVAKPEEMLRNIRSALKPGGKLLMATPDFGSPCAKRFGANYRMLHDRTHVSLFTNESMHRFLRDFGFTIDRVSYPFPERYATAETMERWLDTSKVSPPWPGNWMTFYCTRR